MDRVNRILHHPSFCALLSEIEELERNRPFCGHGMEHLLAVARLAQIYNLEEGCGVEKELLYAAALLHDIGRGEQYSRGIPHDQAGAELAGPILTDCGFTQEERERICAAIAAHRRAESRDTDALSSLLHRADKKCRPCYQCAAAAQCNWPEEKRNKTVE